MTWFARRLAGSIVILVFVVVLAACQSSPFDRPGDPAHAWVNGKWTTGNIPWRQDLDLSVGDGNRIKGAYDLTDPVSGLTHTGSIDGEVIGNRLMLDVKMHNLPENFTLQLEREGTILEGLRSGRSQSWSVLLTRAVP